MYLQSGSNRFTLRAIINVVGVRSVCSANAEPHTKTRDIKMEICRLNSSFVSRHITVEVTQRRDFKNPRRTKVDEKDALRRSGSTRCWRAPCCVTANQRARRPHPYALFTSPKPGGGGDHESLALSLFPGCH